MPIPIFLSFPQPHRQSQTRFIERISAYLRERGLEPRTLGVTEYDVDAPLRAIRRLLLESNGLITIAFRRLHIAQGTYRKDADEAAAIGKVAQIADRWLTSPFCQIEPAMAYQLGLPVLILREEGVQDEGVLEKGVMGISMPVFSLDDPTRDYLVTPECRALLRRWEGMVGEVVIARGTPPRLYSSG